MQDAVGAGGSHQPGPGSSSARCPRRRSRTAPARSCRRRPDTRDTRGRPRPWARSRRAEGSAGSDPSQTRGDSRCRPRRSRAAPRRTSGTPASLPGTTPSDHCRPDSSLPDRRRGSRVGPGTRRASPSGWASTGARSPARGCLVPRGRRRSRLGHDRDPLCCVRMLDLLGVVLRVDRRWMPIRCHAISPSTRALR